MSNQPVSQHLFTLPLLNSPPLLNPKHQMPPFRPALLFALAICLLLVIVLLYRTSAISTNTHTSPSHLEHHVLLTVDAETHKALWTVVFHRDKMGLFRKWPVSRVESESDEPEEPEMPEEPDEPGEVDAEYGEEQLTRLIGDTSPTALWTPCAYTWHPHKQTLALTNPFAHSSQRAHPLPLTIPFTDAVTLPDQGLEGYALTRPDASAPSGTVTHYLWKVRPTTSPSLVGKWIRFRVPTMKNANASAVSEESRLPFESCYVATTRRVQIRTDHTSTTTTHPMSYRPSLPSTSRWTCALYIRGRPLNTSTSSTKSNVQQQPQWKMATIRLNTSVQRADMQWRDQNNVFHRVFSVPYDIESRNLSRTLSKSLSNTLEPNNTNSTHSNTYKS